VADGPLVPDQELVELVAARLSRLRARIAERTDRPVRVVCVTKGHPAEVLAAALAAGCTELGESYAQEVLRKVRRLGAGAGSTGDGVGVPGPGGGATPIWHFIGRLQSNKVRQLVGLVDLWHTVDRASLAAEIARRAPGAKVLVQLDLAGIPGRGGCPPGDGPALVARCVSMGLHVVGLMGVGIPGPPERSRHAFGELVAMADDLGLPERSIGMSSDLDVAVEQGATIVRVGSALVGPRPDP
jgi:PLP dependent protein